MDIVGLDAVREGALEAAAFLKVARKYMADPEGREALYDGLRRRVGLLIRGVPSEEEVREWGSVLSRVSALATGGAESDKLDGSLELATRLSALKDLTIDLRYFSSFYAVEKLRDQPHFRNCLAALETSGGEMPKSDLISQLGLKDANATRILKILEAAQLVRRQKFGRSVSVLLTPAGLATICEWRSPHVDPGPSAENDNTNEKVFLLVIGGGIPGLPQSRQYRADR